MTSLGIVIDMYVNSSDQMRREKRTIERLTRNLAISWKRVLLIALRGGAIEDPGLM